MPLKFKHGCHMSGLVGKPKPKNHTAGCPEVKPKRASR